MKKNLFWIFVVLFFASLACSLGQTPVEQTAPSLPPVSPTDDIFPATSVALPPPADPGAVIQPDDLIYLGAFRLPGESGNSSWDYSGRGLTYYPNGDPNGGEDGFPGSLFGVGHDQQQFVSEISIPVPVISQNMQELNSAETLQPFADITGGMFGETEIPRLGLQYLPDPENPSGGRLYFVHGQHFQDFEPSHGSSGLDLGNPQPAGPWIFDGYTNYVTSDYVFEIPENWAAAIPGVPRLATGRFREGVWGGRGPTLFAYNPSPDGNGLQAITPLLLYGTQQPGLTDIVSDENTQMAGYLEDDSWWGGAWLTRGENSAVIFVGTKALGRSWYGFANGVIWEYDCAEKNPPTCPEVPEWPYENRGYWAEDYQPQIIFFNPAELTSVANGQMETWLPQPYASLDLSATFFNPEINLADYKTDLAGAVAYDRERGLLYIIERLADEYKSVIHVWRIR
ncbi:MAG: hypothetical protein CVU44_21145 [Chloroflexi bacterium HGW-Chloroflexi-6]|nr:MAG: hypothetical protein CVU44_21145 [Chloroflexi bacterium HGW-Chloroflexi-6]